MFDSTNKCEMPQVVCILVCLSVYYIPLYWCVYFLNIYPNRHTLIGLSLSEPHTSGTALHMRMHMHACLLAALCLNFKCTFICWRAALAVIMAQVKARTKTYFLFVTAATNRRSMTDCSQTIQIQYTCHGLRSLKVRADARDPAHDFNVKLSPSMCAIAAARNLTACNL